MTAFQLPERPPRARPNARIVPWSRVRRLSVRRSRLADAPVVRRPRMTTRIRPRVVEATVSRVVTRELCSSASGGEAAGGVGLSGGGAGGGGGGGGGGGAGGAPGPWQAREPESVNPCPPIGMNCQSYAFGWSVSLKTPKVLLSRTCAL